MTERLIDTYLNGVQALWPGDPGPRLHRGRGPGPRLTSDELEFTVLPSAATPRLLVPTGNHQAAARAMMRFSAALSAEETMKRLGVSALLRTGSRATFRDRVTVIERPGSIREHLAEILGEPVDMSIGMGTARTNRKTVLQLFDRRGRSLAFAKIGGSPTTDELVLAEADALRCLGEVAVPEDFAVPRLLHVGTWEGRKLLVMSALKTTFWHRPDRQFSLPEREMTRFHALFREPDATLTDSPLWPRLTAAHASLMPSTERDRLGEALERLAEISSDHPLPLGAWHGDWTPWNMCRNRRGRIQLWDFERFATGVPLGMDRAHYGVNAITHRDGTDVQAVNRGLALAGISRHPGTDDHLVGATYLADITARYLVGAQGHLGETIALRSRTMLHALCTWLSDA